ncbi:peptidoglycan-binding protein [Oscillatoria salina]|uniref:peptidoglycan-binding protein n=1 Tax=Oscillatoria salina TaxID=331517 RepID=UPI0013B679E8|nr:peptidoglycan-binding protein [Oscillatoria salina]MBZ8180839.1 SH3 domain-containing protein [Oscillatoria salina IIICB1]NET90093.1 SH3 domain-containing protein [Kamptonema sp. SIO1D9]
MEAFAYLQIAQAYESKIYHDRELTLLDGLDWRTIRSGWYLTISVFLALSTLSIAKSAMALQRGDRGPSVVELQNSLKLQGVFPPDLESTGYYGPTTEDAVATYQRLNSIPADGVAGLLTLETLYGYRRPDPIIEPEENYCRRVATKGARLNIRSQPTTNSRIIGKLPQGTQIVIENRGSYGWVPLSNGGYVSSAYLGYCLE